SRQALALSLKRAFCQPDLAVDGESALTLTTRQRYDVIFLDVQMPGMDGFELCTKIRDGSLNRMTPIVFVTSHGDFGARTRSTLIGGNELMGKPFLIFEITVKALTLALHGRLREHHQTALPEIAPGRNLLDGPAAVGVGPLYIASTADAARLTIPKLPPLDADAASRIFLTRGAKIFGSLQELCQTILKTTNPDQRQTLLADAFLRINSIIPQAGSPVLHPAYQLSTALEGLLRKLLQNPRH